jgi:hypothetical protein
MIAIRPWCLSRSFRARCPEESNPIAGLVLVACLLLVSHPCSGATWLVKPDGTGSMRTIQDAIQAASPGDTVALADGTFLGDGNRDVGFLGKDLVVLSQSGHPTACVVDAQGSFQHPRRVFRFLGGEGPGAVIQAITVRGGFQDLADCGGGVFCGPASAPVLRDCIFTENTGYNGGGVGVGQGAHPKIERCLFYRNHGGDYGGGLGYDQFTVPGSVTVIDCRFEENDTGTHGAGAAVDHAARFSDCLFIHNHSGTSGGAFFHCGAGLTVFERCTFFENSAQGGGAGTT